LVLLRNVQREKLSLADALGNRSARLLIAIGHKHPRARLRKRFRNGGADA
jgi:metallophosphoesterase superfamily enzyme